MKLKFYKKKIIWIACSSVGIFLYFTCLSYFGQNNRKAHENIVPKEKVINCKTGWKFRSGDDINGSKNELDDHSWTTVNSDSLPSSYNGELSWFRLHLSPDTFFMKRQVVFVMNHSGASEIYLDGSKIAGFGKVSSIKEKEKNFDPGAFPINVDLQKGDTHLIAIRYSNLHYKDFEALSFNNHIGFSLTIADAFITQQGQIEFNKTEIVCFSVGIFLLTLSFIHFLLFLFYRQAKENLFYSLFVFCYSMIFLLVGSTLVSNSPSDGVWLENALLVFVNPFLFLSLLTFIFWLFQKRFPFGGWLAMVVSIPAVTYVFLDWPGQTVYFIIFIWMAVFTVIAMIRGTWASIKEKRPGFKILTAGVGTFALFIIVCLSIVFYSTKMNLSIHFQSTFILTIILITLMSIPISMSVYLAYTSSRTNKDLKLKLLEVENLSTKNIEQEKEKQKILETQKETLELQVKERTHEIVEQNKVIEEKNKNITDSLNYAKRIQEAILPSRELKKELFPESFVLFKPKDIVSGDFYWYTKAESWNERHRTDGKGKRIIASVDCTGHGVPGAFMSMVGNNLLTEIVLEKGITKPSEILDALHEGVRSSLKQNVGGSETRDGMDIAICCFDHGSDTIEYAGAQRPLWIIRNADPTVIEEVKADKFSIGGLASVDRKKFTNHSIDLKKGDLIYIFSDGFADQFGGADGKKFMSKRFKQLFLSLAHLPMHEQENELEAAIEKWKGRTVQIDDILVIGIKM